MKLINLFIASMVMLMGLVGCVHVDYVKDAPQRVKATDWSKMETVSVHQNDFYFSPSELIFHVETPYKLEIINNGTTKHYFTAGEFFKAIATRKVQSNTDGEIKAPYFTALEVFPSRSLDLYFVPVKKGSYDLRCTIEGHTEKGMVGRIVIE